MYNYKNILIILNLIFFLTYFDLYTQIHLNNQEINTHCDDLHLREPFVFPIPENNYIDINNLVSIDDNNNSLLRTKKEKITIIPYRIGFEYPLTSVGAVNFIARYSESFYSEWEAEGNVSGVNEKSLSYNNLIGEIFTDINGRNGVSTKPFAIEDTLIRGPGYKQQTVHTKFTPGKNIIYNAVFSMMIKPVEYTEIFPLPVKNNFDIVCVIQVIASDTNNEVFVKEKIVAEKFISVSHFEDYNMWNDYSFVIDYVLNELPENFYTDEILDWNYDFILKNKYVKHIEFRIIWKQLDYLQLFVDKITLSDINGSMIYNDLFVRELIKHQLFDTHMLFENYTNMEDILIAWYLEEKPSALDNYIPLRILDEILNKYSNGSHRLFTLDKNIKKEFP